MYRTGIYRNRVGNWVSMEKIKDLSLKAAIIIYMAAALAISTVLSFSLTHYAENVQEDIWFKYVDKEEYMESIAHESGNNYLTIIPRIPAKYMSHKSESIRVP